MMLLSMDRLKDAEQHIRKMIGKNVGDPWLYCQLAEVLARTGRAKEALEAAHESIRLDPESDAAHFALAHAHIERSDTRAARRAIEEALRLDPDDPTYHAMHARILVDADKLDAALAAASTGLAIDPEHDSCRMIRSIVLGKLGRTAEADAESLALLEDEPDDECSHVARGLAKLHAGDGAVAEQHFVEALRIDPEYETARIGLSQALQMRNPFTGRLLQFLVLAERIPAWQILVGAIVLARLSSFLERLRIPICTFLGRSIDFAIFTIIVLTIAAPALFGLVVWSNKRVRHVVSEMESKGLKVALVPLILSFVFLISWTINGARGVPVHALAWVCTAMFAHEIYERKRAWVRKCMMAVAGTALAISSCALYADFAIIAPKQLDIAANSLMTMTDAVSKKPLDNNQSGDVDETRPTNEMAETGEIADTEDPETSAVVAHQPEEDDAVADTSSETLTDSDGETVETSVAVAGQENESGESSVIQLEAEALLAKFVSIARLRRKIVIYPVLALLLTVGFREEMADWFARRAPNDDE